MKVSPILILSLISLSVAIGIVTHQVVRKKILKHDLAIAEAEFKRLEPKYAQLAKAYRK